MRLIDADVLKAVFIRADDDQYYTIEVKNVIDNSPSVETYTKDDMTNEYLKGYNACKSIIQPTSEWIPIKYRPLNVDERIQFADHYGIEYSDTIDEKAFDCPMPEDGQEILISTAWGVRADVACNDVDGEGFVCYGLENNDDWDGVDAWMPMPTPYEKGAQE